MNRGCDLKLFFLSNSVRWDFFSEPSHFRRPVHQMADSSSACEKRTAEALSDTGFSVSTRKRSVVECARCDSIRNVRAWHVKTMAGLGRQPLCDVCLPSNPREQTVYVLHELESHTHLPQLRLESDYIGSALGLFQKRDGIPNCSTCHRTAGVIVCRQMEWDKYKGWTGPTDAINLCITCRTCVRCDRIVKADRGFDARSTRLCYKCAQWCNECHMICDRDHFQNAYCGIDLLCASVCCSCQVRDAIVRHPHSRRSYCRSCVENRRYYPGKDEDDMHEDKFGWSAMVDALAPPLD
jgi:hypothetical protein